MLADKWSFECFWNGILFSWNVWWQYINRRQNYNVSYFPQTCLMPWKAQSQNSSSAQRNDAWNTESNMLGTQLFTRKFSGNSGSETQTITISLHHGTIMLSNWERLNILEVWELLRFDALLLCINRVCLFLSFWNFEIQVFHDLNLTIFLENDFHFGYVFTILFANKPNLFCSSF